MSERRRFTGRQRRKPRIVVSSPERVATSLRKHMAADDLKALARLLLDGSEG